MYKGQKQSEGGVDLQGGEFTLLFGAGKFYLYWDTLICLL